MFLHRAPSPVFAKGGRGGWSRARRGPRSAAPYLRPPQVNNLIWHVLRVSHVAEAAEQLLHQEQGNFLQDGLLRAGCGRRASSVAGELRGRLSLRSVSGSGGPRVPTPRRGAARRAQLHPLSEPSTRSSRPLVCAGRGSGR